MGKVARRLKAAVSGLTVKQWKEVEAHAGLAGPLWRGEHVESKHKLPVVKRKD